MPRRTDTISPFARRVYEALSAVPQGRVITYAALARKIGCRSPRAVGQALRANPFAPQVPCHRVIASDLTPGGFFGHKSGPNLVRKLRLLASEGILFENNRLADPSRVL
jgi:methylated-DNA-[protein]-cysteine S-methyltransferase